MRVLGIDLGTKRIGVALSDASGTLASPLEVVARTNDRQALGRRLRELVDENDVELVVIGLPLSLDGSVGPAAENILGEVDRLRATLGVPIETYDERLTTVTAERMLGESDIRGARRRAIIDKVAAAVILQTWLDGRRAEVPPEDNS